MNNPHTTDSAENRGDRDRDSLDWPHHTGTVDRVLDQVQARVLRRRMRRRRVRISVAVFAATLLLSGMAWQRFASRPRAAAHRESARISLPSRQLLPDGSEVELKDGARIRVDFAGGRRLVELEQGEAHFQVAKDAGRPFIVTAKGVEVRAVGTAFLVELDPASVVVLVTEGRVAVNPGERVSAARGESGSKGVGREELLLDAGTRVALKVVPASSGPQSAISTPIVPQEVAPAVVTVTSDEIAQLLAWRVPRLEFTRTPLSEAVAMINRFSTVHLVLADEATGAVEVSGILRANNVEPLFHLLATDYGITVERHGQTEAVLRRRK